MGISFKVSKKGTRFHRKAQPSETTIVEDDDVEISKESGPINESTRKRVVNFLFSFFINLWINNLFGSAKNAGKYKRNSIWITYEYICSLLIWIFFFFLMLLCFNLNYVYFFFFFCLADKFYYGKLSLIFIIWFKFSRMIE